MNFLQFLLEWLKQFWPVRIVNQNQRGLYFRKGVLKRVLKAGKVHFFLPVRDEILIVNVMPDVVNLPNQVLTTSDDISVVVSVNVEYEVLDPVAAFVSVQNFVDNFSDACSRHIAKRVRDKTWKELLEDQGDVERSAKKTLETVVKDWGVKIHDVGFTVFAKTKVYSLPQVA